MRFVIVDNKKIELDIYGRVPGAEVGTILNTRIDRVECTVRVQLYEGQLV